MLMDSILHHKPYTSAMKFLETGNDLVKQLHSTFEFGRRNQDCLCYIHAERARKIALKVAEMFTLSYGQDIV